MLNPCLCNLKNYLGPELTGKLAEVLNDGAGSPGAMAGQAQGRARKLNDAKSAVAAGIKSFKDRFGLPPGRRDGAGPSLSDLRAKAQGLRAKTDQVLTAISGFLAQFPECGSQAEVVALAQALTAIDSRLDPWSAMDTDKLDAEISAARAQVDESAAMMTDAARILKLMGACR